MPHTLRRRRAPLAEQPPQPFYKGVLKIRPCDDKELSRPHTFSAARQSFRRAAHIISAPPLVNHLPPHKSLARPTLLCAATHKVYVVPKKLAAASHTAYALAHAPGPSAHELYAVAHKPAAGFRKTCQLRFYFHADDRDLGLEHLRGNKT